MTAICTRYRMWSIRPVSYTHLDVYKRQILDQVKEVTHTDMVTILKNLDRELVKGALSGAKFKEYFFANCKCDKIAEAVKEVLA